MSIFHNNISDKLLSVSLDTKRHRLYELSHRLPKINVQPAVLQFQLLCVEEGSLLLFVPTLRENLFFILESKMRI